MDIFDEEDVPVGRGRGRGRFQPKAKPTSKPIQRISASQKATLGANERETVPASDNMDISRLDMNDDRHKNAVDSTLAVSSTEFQKSNSRLLAVEADSTNPDVDHVTIDVPAPLESNDDLSNGLKTKQSLEPSIVEAQKMTNTSQEFSEHPEVSCYDWNQSDVSARSPLQFGEYFGSADVLCTDVTEQSNVQSVLNSREPAAVKPVAFETDPFRDILLEPATSHLHAQGRFQPKIKPRPRIVTSIESSVFHDVLAENSQASKLSPPNHDKAMGLSESVCAPLSDEDNLESVEPSQRVAHKALSSMDTFHDGVGQFHPSPGKLLGESSDIFSGLESLDDFLSQTSGTNNPTIRTNTEKKFAIQACSFGQSPASGTCDAAQVQMLSGQERLHSEFAEDSAVFNSRNTETDTPRCEPEEVDVSNPSFNVDDDFICSSVSISDVNPPFPNPEILEHEELTNTTGGLGLGDGVFSENVHEMHEEDTIRSSEACRSMGPPRINKNCTGGASKPTSDAVESADRSSADCTKSHGNGGENFEGYGVGGMHEKENVYRKSNKTVVENGKSSRKRNKETNASEKSKEQPRKKFSHSTRRTKKYADKAFIEAMEEEIDPSTYRIKDIIQYGEYHEWKSKKEAAARTTSSSQRNASSFHEASQDKEETFASEDETVPQDDTSENVPLASSFFNYHSFMVKTPRGKWTKQETELFYDAVRQFGTDFAMIQQLFPGRDRNQIKLKYKKEERQHPLRLFEAVNNRAKDYSHFKSVIELLQKASAESEAEKWGPAAVNLTGEEEAEDVSPDINEEEAAKVEENIVHNNGDVKTQQNNDVDVEKIESPLKSNNESDVEDDLDWCQYTSNY